MRFEYLVLLIIAFNVVSAVLQRRAKKARARNEAAHGSDGTSADAYSAEEEPDEWEIDPWDERPAREPAARRSVARSETETVPERGERMPSLARDIMDQLARDLGLKRPAPPRETRPSAPSPPPLSSRESRLERMESPTPSYAVESAPVKPVASRLADAEIPGAVAVPGVKTDALRRSLRGSRNLREAFVLKEILDAPVARRPRSR